MSWFIQQALAGNCFIGTAPVAGVTIPVANSTAQTFALWNPAGSQKNLVLGKLQLGAISATTPTLGTWVLGVLQNAGSAIGTPISAFTATVPTNAIIGGGKAAVGRFALAATTTAVSTFFVLGFSRETTTATIGPMVMTYDFNGQIIVPPNTLIALNNTTVQTQPWEPSITWAEVAI
jgi:hypothetical protein